MSNTTSAPAAAPFNEEEILQKIKGLPTISTEPIVADTREEYLAEWKKRVAPLMAMYPDKDFESAFMKQHVDFQFNMKEGMSKEDQDRHNELYEEMVKVHATDPTAAEKLFWEMRGCLASAPQALEHFDKVFGTETKPVGEIVAQLVGIQSLAKKAKTANAEAGEGGLPVAK